MRAPLRTLLVAVPLALAVFIGLTGCAPAPEPPAEEAAQAAAPADDGVLAPDLLKDWESLKDTMMALADAMPAEKYGYKPTDEVRNFGEQLMHITGANLGFLGRLGSSVAAPEIGEPTEKADIMQAMSDSFDFGSEVLRGQTDAWCLEKVDGGFLGQATRARIVARTMSHTWSEYGVMTVYLRLNDIVPPASR